MYHVELFMSILLPNLIHSGNSLRVPDGYSQISLDGMNYMDSLKMNDMTADFLNKDKKRYCRPYLQPLKVGYDIDSNVMYYPQCIRVNKCASCCNDSVRSCLPTKNGIKNKTYQVKKLEIIDGSKTKLMENEIFTVEEHTQCEFRCTDKEKGCKDFQKFDENECKCVCKESKEERICRSNKNKIWNTEKCSCECTYMKSRRCTTGTKFNTEKCQCIKINYKNKL